MTADRCPRLFEAEAMRDGRLGDAERASFERHTKTCAACAREVRSLDALAQALRESLPEPGDELRVRRERTRLLAAFDRELLLPERPSVPRGRWVWPLAAAVIVSALVLWRARSAPVAVPAASRAVVRADDTAAWSERLDGDREDVLLEHGALWVHVDHGAAHRRLMVILPDGELEDTGTTFTIAAGHGRTTRVTVEEGSVVLRLRGEVPVRIGPGETWTPSMPAPSPSVTSPTTSEQPPSASPLAPRMAGGPAPRASSPAPTALPADASLDFRAAMAALDRGDNREAAAGFAGFLTAHPRDPRAEDAAYLRVIALERCGDRSATRAAALEYLDRYPTGFRRAEVESLSR